MDISKRIAAFIETGKELQQVLDAKSGKNLISNEAQGLFDLIPIVHQKNAWFSEFNVRNAIAGIVSMLNESDLLEWLSINLPLLKSKKKASRVGIVMAGNLPLVGFHDLLCVLLAGDFAVIKMSSDDLELLPIVLRILENHDERIINSYHIEKEALKGIDKIIATGSDNTARYFEYYFAQYPRIIRKSRTSLGVLPAAISETEIKMLAKDMFQYFGLGCRNVSKLFIPEGFDVPRLIDHLRTFDPHMDNVKYINNLEYHKSIMLINGEQFLDGGFFLMRESQELFSPISVTNYEFYANIGQVDDFIEQHAHEIQCIVGSTYEVTFGQAQLPKLWDYADKVDTMKFLLDC